MLDISAVVGIHNGLPDIHETPAWQDEHLKASWMQELYLADRQIFLDHGLRIEYHWLHNHWHLGGDEIPLCSEGGGMTMVNRFKPLPGQENFLEPCSFIYRQGMLRPWIYRFAQSGICEESIASALVPVIEVLSGAGLLEKVGFVLLDTIPKKPGHVLMETSSDDFSVTQLIPEAEVEEGNHWVTNVFFDHTIELKGCKSSNCRSYCRQEQGGGHHSFHMPHNHTRSESAPADIQLAICTSLCKTYCAVNIKTNAHLKEHIDNGHNRQREDGK